VNKEAEELLAYLEGFLTEGRRNRIQNILQCRTRHVTLVLEDLIDPHNASACLRSAEACGIQDVHIIENRHEFSVKSGVSMGSAHWLSIYRYREQSLRLPSSSASAHHTGLPASNGTQRRPADQSEQTRECFRYLKEKGYTIYATSPHQSSIALPDVSLDGPVAIVFGSEKDGISPVARELADHCLRIPMYGFTESFNISVSAAIAVYDLTSRLRKSDKDWKLSESEKSDLRLAWARHSLKRSDLLERQFWQNNKNEKSSQPNETSAFRPEKA
tara:strand:+ start:101881 stop:102699 length:819 start_codon:yes stop_codon:yes gene_type:complete